MELTERIVNVKHGRKNSNDAQWAGMTAACKPGGIVLKDEVWEGHIGPT